ncbi:MAG: hypothetical protein A3J10_04345 [Candidatus Sungbacteria bacterium RIFCSPLOWO2_02_FULL_54_10]|uniref:Uncharacterized protein n=2 Tax=Candidatus Sungiibacteriota TaxID=1817917 RepID=A0A1G2L902_9BACT|nr:MAG: hypothetical protein A2679_00830 [Candidatus Sungbacteria bacterium RIFCSPHIGHO2_01_FULL_54_26]OHA03834.1 MAG: hypothetical protein A3C92_04020 [Candidatus Sungbacteria bacterium RIFCSPHIGHO2_02_FULL_53_17]OHA08135.1 MAG: hypothetical protein A3B34_04120 [Candidatus Sungbacteria bacterium RIFCSPLOWO2_01_FULL_54_21]OHA13228.1 MAG: hypothetical protein A3J10_04345 [Candidatus Sungbacteria bacterium RIFCSPLOWO2_02_FULL_54_10]
MLQAERARFTSRQYEKLAEWGERVALVLFGSVVVQQIVQGVPLADSSVVIGIIATALAYGLAYRWLSHMS